MRGSVVFLAVFAVTSCSAGVNRAHFVKSGITGPGTGRGNEDAPGIEESAFGNGKNDGHNIGKRSNPSHDVAKQAVFRSAAGRRQQMIDPSALFPKPILPPQFPIPAPPIVEVPPPNLIGPIFVPPLVTKPWDYLPPVESHDLPLRRAMPSMLERKTRPLPALKFFPLSEVKSEAMKIISNILSHARILPAILPKPSAGSSFARSQDSDRSDLKNSCCRYSGLRSYSPLRSYPTLPGPVTDDVIGMPLYKHVRNTAGSGTEENFRREVRSAIIQYLVQFWQKISKWFKPGSNSGAGIGGLPPVEENSTEGGREEFEPGLPEEHEVHTERPPEEYVDDVIIEPVTPPVDDSVDIIHLLSEEGASETAEDSAKEDGSEVDEDYYGPIDLKPQQDTNWEARRSTRMGDSYVDFDDDTYEPSWYGPIPMARSMFYSNWEARHALGNEDVSEDVASKIKDTSAGIRRKNSDTVTDIFGRLADD